MTAAIETVSVAPEHDRTTPKVPPHPHSMHCTSRCVNTLTLFGGDERAHRG